MHLFHSKHIKQAYYRNMIGPMYLWIIPMWYNTGWWRTNSTSFSNNVSCTDEIMSKVIDRIIGIVPDGFLTLQNESLVTFSGLVSIILNDITMYLLCNRLQRCILKIMLLSFKSLNIRI